MPSTALTEHAGIRVPLICGAMYPCSNPELVAAASAAGALGIIQPISMTFVHGHTVRDGIRLIRRLTDAPVGFNALIEASNRIYLERMMRWVDEALEEGVRFFVTALGKPDEVVRRVHAAGGVVYHDVTDRRWALRGRDAGVDGLICVNDRAGGHAGKQDPRHLFEALEDLGLPLVCAGGVGTPDDFREALATGYAGVQMGTRFIATTECRAHADYKRAILDAEPDDIVLTDRISGIPVSVINTPFVQRVGTRAGPIARRLLRHRRGKHLVRSWYALRSGWQLKRASLEGVGYRDVFQAGRSVGGVRSIEPVGDIVSRFAAAAGT